MTAMALSTSTENIELILIRKFIGLPWGLVLLASAISFTGIAMLYSVAGGSFEPWASRQTIHFIIGIIFMVTIALIDIKFWYGFAYFGYILGLALLVLVEFRGVEGGLGAQRWLNIGGFRFQPSEIAKIMLVLALARYFNDVHYNNIKRLTTLIVPAILIGLSSLLVLKQPNLGTAAIMIMMSGAVVFLAGIGWKKFVIAGIAIAIVIPVAWQQGLVKDYQKQRVITFLNPESDPLGSGYNIIQSKIAIGSGGFFGKGFLNGTQSRLSFLPEKQTDFIFSIVAEEFGFVGGAAMVILYGLIIMMAMRIGTGCYSQFGQLMALGVAALLFLHVFINIGMVSGILPVVGVPLPLLSYGGSSMISTFIGLGFILNAHAHKDVDVNTD